MWYWIIKVSILSLVFIFLLHYLYSFFVSTLTVPKVKDLVTLPQEKYNEMFHSLQQQQSQSLQRATNDNDVNISTQSMKEDLIHFLKEIGSDSTSNSNSTSNSVFNNNFKPMSLSPSDSFNSNISSFSFSK
jgi:predicted PurR-regulated permease PerM